MTNPLDGYFDMNKKITDVLMMCQRLSEESENRYFFDYNGALDMFLFKKRTPDLKFMYFYNGKFINETEGLYSKADNQEEVNSICLCLFNEYLDINRGKDGDIIS